MKTVHIILILVAAMVIFMVGFSAWWGAFKRIRLTVAEQGGETLVYQEMKGDYRQSGVVMDKVYYSLLNDYHMETYKGFGIYYDDPRKVETSQLRSEIGCIIEEADVRRLGELHGSFLIKTYPKTRVIVTEFPHKGKLSVFFGMMKVYPALNKYIRQHGYDEQGPVMEIYDIPGKRIVYRKELAG
jgi:hypothetical protein